MTQQTEAFSGKSMENWENDETYMLKKTHCLIILKHLKDMSQVSPMLPLCSIGCGHLMSSAEISAESYTLEAGSWQQKVH